MIEIEEADLAIEISIEEKEDASTAEERVISPETAVRREETPSIGTIEEEEVAIEIEEECLSADLLAMTHGILKRFREIEKHVSEELLIEAANLVVTETTDIPRKDLQAIATILAHTLLTATKVEVAEVAVAEEVETEVDLAAMEERVLTQDPDQIDPTMTTKDQLALQDLPDPLKVKSEMITLTNLDLKVVQEANQLTDLKRASKSSAILLRQITFLTRT